MGFAVLTAAIFSLVIARCECRTRLSHSRSLAQSQLNFGTSTIPQAVDNRQYVEDPRQFPFNTIGILSIVDAYGERFTCTGALVGPYHVLTAAHCLYDHQTQEYIYSARFFPAYSSDLSDPSPYGYADMVDADVPEGFANCGTGRYSSCHQSFDFGVMEIDYGYNLWMNFSYNNMATGQERINTAGYPGDLNMCLSSSNYANCMQYHVSCTEGRITSDRTVVRSDCFTFGGQSGSPIWQYYPSSGIRVIRGVLISAPTGGGSGNFALITPNVYNAIIRYINDDRK